GDADRIVAWLDAQDLRGLDAAVVSLDMLAYGGLVASRVHGVPEATARRRLEAIARLRRRRPDLPVYGSSVIMRLAPTAEPRNERWRAALARWAEIAPRAAGDPEAAAELRSLEETIPADTLADYRRARARNLAVNLAAVDLVRRGILDFLVLSQDDAKPEGVHVADRERLLREVRAARLETRVAVQPGADEVSMLLVTRALLGRHRAAPTVGVEYVRPAAAARVMPFEDRPLGETVRAHIAAAGARPTAGRGDLHLVVFASRHEPGAAAEAVDRIARALAGPRRVALADVDPAGDVQGGDRELTEALVARGHFMRLAGYAAWNTAGNTIGTALPHGLLSWLASERLARDPARRARLARAQTAFLLHRLVDDYVYHSLVRPAANRRGRTIGESDGLEAFIAEGVREQTARLRAALRGQPIAIGPRGGRPTIFPLGDVAVTGLRLPWGRTFEAEIEIAVTLRAESRERPASR
ncbi:MAG TPA: DUF4127 family protein, partial [Vicinamibacterales bacterium]|nr:DUF4127 family protein [Vicinamibacterales bacterium]